MDNLIAKSVAGLAFLLAVLALAIFLPAGTLNFWQGWAYLAVFGGCTALVTIYLARNDRSLLADRVSLGPVAERRRSQQVIQALAAVAFIAVFVLPALDHRFGWSSVPAFVSLAADALVALGFYIVFRVFRENTYTRATIDVSAGQTVIATGPYAVVRHPMYAGALLLVIFTPLALGSWVAMPVSLPLVLVIAARLLDEETFLAANLDGYAAYRQKVRNRLVPMVW